MTIKDAIQHPATGNIKLLLIGFAVGLLAQHSIDLKEQWAALDTFLSSEQFKAGLVTVLGILAALQQSLPQAGNVLQATLETFASQPRTPVTLQTAATRPHISDEDVNDIAAMAASSAHAQGRSNATLADIQEAVALFNLVGKAITLPTTSVAPLQPLKATAPASEAEQILASMAAK